jgi:urea transport system permease protein
MTAVPTMGSNFIVQAFVSVVVGGANVIAGTTPAAAVLAVIQTALTASYGQLFGQIGLLVTVIVVIRLMPQGLGNLFTRLR